MSTPAIGSRRPRVALLINSSCALGRGVLLGVAQYVKEHGPWTVFLQDRTAHSANLGWLRHWQGDGLITRSCGQPMLRALQKLALPVVDLNCSPREPKLASVRTDDAAVARLAAEHFLERGFRQFAFYGERGAGRLEARGAIFRNLIQNASLTCHCFDNSERSRRRRLPVSPANSSHTSSTLAQWLEQLPKPVGVMAHSDLEGRAVLEACREVGLEVPEEVAVVGVNNDEVICELADPPLSSVALNHHRMGYEAAAVLDAMIRTARHPNQPLLLEPTGVVTRRSTDVLAIEDPHVATALRFIRQHACEGIDVGDILRVVPLSRSALERKFNAILHHSPKTEILRVRLHHARHLLAETDFSLALVAEKLGLKHTEYFNVIFKKQMGITPGQFRSQIRRTDWSPQPLLNPAEASQPLP